MPVLAGIAVYMLIQFAIGVWVSRRIASESDYILAGRSLGYGLATFSVFATWFGAETIMGSAGQAYRNGVSAGTAEPFGYGLCLILFGILLAARLWNAQFTTLADLYRRRYSVGTERLAAIVLIPSSVLWAAAQIRAFGQVIAVSAPVNLNAAMAIGAGFTIAYSAFGGMLADAITDLLQGVIIIAGLAILAVVVLGTEATASAAASDVVTRAQVMPADMGVLALLEEWAVPIVGSLVAIELVSRALASRSATVARRSFLMGGVMYIAIGCVPLVLGLVGPRLLPGLADPEQLLPQLARTHLSAALYVVFAGALLSAILSTVDSTLLTSSALLSHNLLVPMLQISDERRKVILARLGVAAFGAAAWVMATSAEGVFALMQESSAFGSAGAVVTMLFALFTRIGGPRAATATLIAGLMMYQVGNWLDLTAPYVTSLLVSLVVYVGVSVFERPGGSAPAR